MDNESGMNVSLELDGGEIVWKSVNTIPIHLATIQQPIVLVNRV